MSKALTILSATSRLLVGLLAIVGVVLPAHAQPASHAVAFVNVNVVPMDRERLLPDQTVIVSDGVIKSIGPSESVKIPRGALRIDGKKKQYLLPGLADMHTHLDRVEDLETMLAHGVTTILNLGPEEVMDPTRERARVATGDLLGPQIFVAQMLMWGAEPTMEAAKDRVDRVDAADHEFLKVYGNWPADVFHETMQYAAAKGVPAIGHGVQAVGMKDTLETGVVMIAHAEEWLYNFFDRSKLDEQYARIPDAVRLSRENGAWLTPNLSAYESLGLVANNPAGLEALLASPRAATLSPVMRREWEASPFPGWDAAARERLIARLAFLKKMVKAFSDGGVPLLAGTDGPPAVGMFPGHSLHEDVRALTDAGLSPFDAISAATRTPGEFIAEYVPHAPLFGVIAPGARADLLLLQSNPLEDVAALKTRVGVMADGHWFTDAELAARVETVAAKYAAEMADVSANADKPQ